MLCLDSRQLCPSVVVPQSDCTFVPSSNFQRSSDTMSTVTDITTTADLSAHSVGLSPNTLLVLYFYTPWTEFCNPISASLSHIASQHPPSSPPSFSIVSVNGKNLPEIAKEYGASTAPCVVFSHARNIIEMFKGADLLELHSKVQFHAGLESTILPMTPAPKDEKRDMTDDLRSHLSQLVSSAPVVLFMKGTPDSPRCRFSRRMVDSLRDHGIVYAHFDVYSNEDVREGLKDFGDWPTYPQLWVASELVGGLEIVRSPVASWHPCRLLILAYRCDRFAST